MLRTIQDPSTRKSISINTIRQKVKLDYLRLLSDLDLRRIAKTDPSEVFVDYRENVRFNRDQALRILQERSERKKSSSPEKELENLRTKIRNEQNNLRQLEEKSEKIQKCKRDLELKILRQKERIQELEKNILRAKEN